jgi:hypothetical protein
VPATCHSDLLLLLLVVVVLVAFYCPLDAYLSATCLPAAAE